MSLMLASCGVLQERDKEPILTHDVFRGIVRNQTLEQGLSFETTRFFFYNSYSEDAGLRHYKCRLGASNFDAGELRLTVDYSWSSDNNLDSFVHGQTEGYSQLSENVSSPGTGWVQEAGRSLLWFYPDGYVLKVEFRNSDDQNWVPNNSQKSAIVSLFCALVDSVPEYNRAAGHVAPTMAPDEGLSTSD
ncbi:hypothetical protein [Actinomyces sp. ZJ308]|uniref:hypothetical protein n=1 Tax=Actinomyces sp. ZJ308 TaxID=2708342 RepID=UPI00141E31EE|nr:hypothetical protein [Actinomyces sp. ZJ308]